MGKNIKVVPGSGIPFTEAKSLNHQFSYIDFHDVEMMPSKSSFDDSSEEGKAQLKLLMHGKSGIIRIQNIGDTGGLGIGDEGLQIEILSPKDKEDYKNVPSCIRTPAGSIIPQVIIPTTYFKGIDHGLRYPSDVEVTSNQESKYKPETDDDNENEEEAQKEGYNWVATAINKSELLNRGVSEEIIDKRLKSQLTYGERDVANKGVTNEHSVKRGIDTPIIGKRTYTCDLSKTEAGPGSCAICYKFIHYDGVGTGITDNDKREVPSLNIVLAGDMDSDDGGSSSGEGSDEESPHPIKLMVPRAGDCLGAVSAFVGQGAMSVPEADKMPPQCRRNENDYTMMPIFFYPIYSGFVMTNSVLNNLSTGSNGLFIKYNNTNINAIYMAKIDKDNSVVAKSDEIKNMIAKDKNTEIVHWFPALFQETDIDKRTEIRLYMPKYESIVFGNTAKVQWVKAVGRFAYCPIFFHRKIKFTYYFKGEYLSEGETKGRYYFYPIVSANIGTGDGEGWTGLNKKGATCLYQNKLNGSSSVEGDEDEEDFGKDKVRFVCNDPEIEEAIYAVDFEFSANSLQRYPIEVFGAVAVYERENFQFQIENDNGAFTFDKSIRSEFTGAVDEQNKFQTTENGNGDDPSNNPTTTKLNKLFGIMTNLSVSSGEDGVTGSMTLDGYPLEQGIKVFKQDQSIGEIDFAVEDDETETETDEEGNESDVPVKHELFKGYGMEIATNDSENNYSITAQLFGINKKMEDMKLVCAPFWDGDRLEMICAYFQNYLRLNIKMIDHEVTSYEDAKVISVDKYFDKDGTWKSESNTIINSTPVAHPSFRVPRSVDWRSPAINFGTGTSCFDALKTLGKVCGCHCIPQLDGTIVFYELNNYGIPFYVNNQNSDDAVSFSASEIISISMSPSLDHKFNSISTFGFLVKKDADGKVQEENNIQFGAFYSKTNGKTTGTLPEVGVQFPWSRMSVGVESAMYTKPELAEVHQNRIKYAVSEIYQGQIQVRGNTEVNHIYQKIKVCGTDFFVMSIEHSLDLSSKIWTTSYGIQCITMPSSSSSVE